MTDIPALDICVDAYPPGRHYHPIRMPPTLEELKQLVAAGRHEEMAVETLKLWQPGQTLRVRIMDGDDEVQRDIEGYAREWLQFANLELEFGNFAEAEIRVTTFGAGFSSQVGTDARRIPDTAATMTLGGPYRNLARGRPC